MKDDCNKDSPYPCGARLSGLPLATLGYKILHGGEAFVLKPEKRQQNALPSRSVPEVKWRGLGKGQFNTPKSHHHLG